MAKDLNGILLSAIEENKIKEKTPDKLPLNPTAEGWSGQEVRRFLAKSLIDNEGSFLAEFKKKMIEIKAQFEDVFGEGNGNIQGQIDSIIENIDTVEATATALATTVINNYNTLNSVKVNKTLTILGIDLQDNITLAEFKTALGDATIFVNGLMTALDKQNLAQTMLDIQDIFTNKADKTDVSGISTLISSLDLSKLNKEFTSLIEEVSLSLSDVFVVDKGSGARKVSLATIASYLSTQELQLFTIVGELPNENQNPNTIYLLTTENEEGQNQLLEYIWIANQERWELIGSVEVDLSNYYTKTEVNGLLEDNVTTAEIVTGTATTQKTVTAKAVHDAIMQIMFNSLGGES